jgi:ABC-type oligopeptide transport system substrate-binding subunit
MKMASFLSILLRLDPTQSFLLIFSERAPVHPSCAIDKDNYRLNSRLRVVGNGPME